MIQETTFLGKMAEMFSVLPQRAGSEREKDLLIDIYQRALTEMDEAAFVRACDHIIFYDDWFPTVARLRAVIDTEQSEAELAARRKALAGGAANGGLVCGRCHGARWVRLGGASPAAAAGSDTVNEQRIIHCPDCTVDGHYSPARERFSIEQNGGVPDPAAPLPTARRTRGDAMAEFRQGDGQVDWESVYWHSRTQRGLDPDVDERPAGGRKDGLRPIGGR